MLRFLNRPYPTITDWRKRLWTAFFIGLFIFLFLYLFQPFGLSAYTGPNKTVIIAGYGLVSFVCCVIIMHLIPPFFPTWFREENWKTWKEIIIILVTVVLIGTGNHLYSYLVGFTPLTLSGFLFFQGITATVALLPVSLFVMLKENQLLRQNLNSAREVNQVIQSHETAQPIADNPIILSSENGKELVQAKASQILFLAAAENYVEVFWNAGGEVQKTLLRSTLARIEEQLKSHPDFFRCHRAYIINLKNVQSVEGNAQGYRVSFPGIERQVPVSRGQIAAFRDRMNR
jgi:hypothetical protein